ncbi:MAG: OmpH family outer membrane protein [Henriciella sp.]|jgi:outer membrane protein
MSLIKSILSVVLLAFIPASLVLPAASAQGTKVVTMDTARILAESAAGQDIAQKLQAIGATIATETEPRRVALEAVSEELEPIIRGKTEQQIQADVAADPELAQKFAQYASDMQRYQLDVQRAGRELDMTTRVAQGQLLQALQPVVETVFETSGADLLLERETVVYANPSLDITDQIIAQLNLETPTIEVTRQTLPQQGQAQ